MTTIFRVVLIGFIASLCSGCGGYYILSTPDQLASAKGDVVPVARLQRNDFFVLAFPVKKSPMRFRIYPHGSAKAYVQSDDDVPSRGEVRSCRTDDLGYAAVKLSMTDRPVYSKPGRYDLKVALQDFEGEEKVVVAPLFVWDPKKPIVAVDLDSLPKSSRFQDSSDSSKALQQYAKTANILYLTREDPVKFQKMHLMLIDGAFPDGPILQWQREYWHIVKDKKWKIPRVVVENRLVSQLEQLKKEFPNFQLGICNNHLAAQVFVDMGMDCVVVNNSFIKGSKIRNVSSWSELDNRPLGMPVSE